MENKKKKFIFIIITLLLPFLFLIILELFFRLIGVGKREELVFKVKENGKEYYQLNPDVGKRYFFNTPEAMIPQLYPQKFPVAKAQNTLRVFLLGGSTMAGFPYQLNARINHLLQDRLETYFPGHRFQVINFAMSAVNSFTVLDFSEEITKYDPDLVIIYMGHNEFYGAFGVGSAEKIGSKAGWIRFYLKLQKIRTFQLIRQLLKKFISKTPSASLAANATLMENMAKQKTIARNSDQFEAACHYFSENLDRIIKNIQNSGCPVIFCTLVSNLKDQYPFISDHGKQLSDQQKSLWQKYFSQGFKSYQQGQYSQALQFYQRCEKIDAAPAELQFMMGKALLKSEKPSEAKRKLIDAKDADLLRFRAPEIFNEIIREKAIKFRLPLAPMDSIFNANSYHGIVGYELITEHLHPNLAGYQLMAKYFALIAGETLSLEPDSAGKQLGEDYFRRKAAITIFDEAIADVLIQRLTSRWPYRQKRNLINYHDPEEKIFIESLVKQYLADQVSWNDAHYRMADFYIKRRQYDKAIAEYQAVIKIVPENYFPYFKIGNLFFTLNRLKEAQYWFQQALRRKNSVFIKAKLGMVLLSLKNFAQAEHVFKDAIMQESKTHSLSPKELGLLHYYYAVCLIQNGKSKAAQNELTTALKFNPQYDEARQLLQLLKTNANVKIQL